jgi:hypothetical protein
MRFVVTVRIADESWHFSLVFSLRGGFGATFESSS